MTDYAINWFVNAGPTGYNTYGIANVATTKHKDGDFASQHGLRRAGPHHEIHLDAFTRTTPQETLRTILRDPVG